MEEQSEPIEEEQDEACVLCNRSVKLTFHHLVPKKVQDKSYVKRKYPKEFDLNTFGIMICSDCHAMIHRKIPHKELALNYNSAEQLKAHPEIEKFTTWVYKQQKKVKRK